jgi:transposase
MLVALFPCRGQPTHAPWRLPLTTVMQFDEALSDRQAADVVRSRTNWKYALSLELTDPGFDVSLLSEFRARLIAGAQEHLLLEIMLTHFKARGFLRAHGQQRTDSTHVLAAIRTLNQLESVGETLRAALNSLAVVLPDWLLTQGAPDWLDRYSVRVQVLACGHNGRLVSSRATNGPQHHWMTAQCRASSPCGIHDACLLTNSVPPGQGPTAVGSPLLQSLHRRLANPATDAAHAQEEREETNAGDELCHAFTQLFTPYHWFPVLVFACLSEYPLRLLLWLQIPLQHLGSGVCGDSHHPRALADSPAVSPARVSCGHCRVKA